MTRFLIQGVHLSLSILDRNENAGGSKSKYLHSPITTSRNYSRIMHRQIKKYTDDLQKALNSEAITLVPLLAKTLLEAWKNGRFIYLCGNGGSAGNSIHLANDFIYGAGVKNGKGLRAEALSANPAVLTCLANDIGYEFIYSEQLKVKANAKDVLIVLSGSGNSSNILKAVEVGNEIGMTTFAILGFTGGWCKSIVQHPIHFEINDMQIAEDLQLIVGHLCMQWLSHQSLDTGTI
jgi:D-sedoheptulose 7-phosphate isomerase